MSIALAWCDFKTYCEEIGPGRGQPPRPTRCVFCDGLRVWFNGWRRVLPTLLVDGRPHRPSEWMALQRVRCARGVCGRSWTLRPPWLYPHRSLEPDVAEAAALAYLLDPHTSYAAVATAVGCARTTVWRWVGWLAALVAPGTLVAAAARVGASGGAEPGLLPREVAAAARARSTARALAVRQAARRSSPRSPCCTARSRSRRPIPVRSAGGSSASSSRSGGWPSCRAGALPAVEDFPPPLARGTRAACTTSAMIPTPAAGSRRSFATRSSASSTSRRCRAVSAPRGSPN